MTARAFNCRGCGRTIGRGGLHFVMRNDSVRCTLCYIGSDAVKCGSPSAAAWLIGLRHPELSPK
jgi:hypothetical protein